MHDVCIIGHVTRDLVRRAGCADLELPGGVPHYAGIALARLGLDTAVLTKLAAGDDDLLRPLTEAGIDVTCRPSPATTGFENAYAGPDMTGRRQAVRAVATPFDPDDLTDLQADVFHLGPLTGADMDAGFLEAVAAHGGRVSLDVQGLVRRVEDGKVRPGDWPEKARGLALMDMVKADREEARLLTGDDDPEQAARRIAAWGPAEVIVTLGRRGAVICARGETLRIPAVAPRRLVDPTGGGDSFMAGYLFHRLQSDDIEAAGRFAAALAACKLERSGAFAARERDVRARLDV